MFSDPASSTGIDYSELKGRLLLVEPTELVTDIETVHGPSNAVRATVTVLDGDQAGTVYDDTLIFPKVLQSQTRSKVGQKVLGRLTQGEATPGKTAPWRLADKTDEDVKVATDYVNNRSTDDLSNF